MKLDGKEIKVGDKLFVIGKGYGTVEKVEEKKQLSWTKEKPTETGWYWHKLVGKPGIHLVFKSTSDEKLRVAFAGHNKSKLVDECYGYWIGPIKEPEGPDVAT